MPTPTEIYKILSRKHGLRINSQSANYLADLLKEDPQYKSNIDLIATEYVALHGNSVIELETLQDLINTVLQKQSIHSKMDVDNELSLNEISKYLAVLDTFKTPNYTYNQKSKSFLLDTTKKPLIAPASIKSLQLRNRYDLLKQRLLRNEEFRKPNFAADSRSYFEITPIKQLKGKPPGRYLLFGMLTQIEEGLIHLEDPDGLIQLEFAENLHQGTGLFCKNCFVMVQGEYTADAVIKNSLVFQSRNHWHATTGNTRGFIVSIFNLELR